ncbi:hypothetical protein MNV49_004883 [Pseudohyphozyma bogoriensis]|nr:hypothetical protein MNV49_004883 [Pseudohyphozyma bogoriensis]
MSPPASLKAELKAWEAQFRAAHGRDPTKQDIKQEPAIADKYKEYNKAKTATTSSTRANAAPPPPAAHEDAIFKTPTKPKPKRSTAHPSASTSTAQPNPSTSTYVVANSPSKLRALVAAHSFGGSPNKKPSQPGLGTGVDLRVVGSPEKYNPFKLGSPSKKSPAKSSATAGFGRRLFASDDAMDVDPAPFPGSSRDKKTKPSSARSVASSSTSSVSKAAPWESLFGAPAPPLPPRSFRRTLSTLSSSSNGNDNPFSTSQSSTSLLDPPTLANGALPDDDDDDDDEVLGPSPVKASSTSKKFKPLISTSVSSFTSKLLQSSQPSPPQPPTAATTKQIFAAEFTPKPVANTKNFAKEKGRQEKPVKGPEGVTGRARENGAGGQKKSRKGEFSEDDDVVDNERTQVGRRNGNKVTKARTTAINEKEIKPAPKARKKRKFTHVEDDLDEMEVDEDGNETLASVKRREERGAFVLDVDSEAEPEDDDGLAARREKVVVRPRRAYGGAGEADDDLAGTSGQGSLFYRDKRNLLAKDTDDEDEDEAEQQDDGQSMVPEELVELLSLRSPVKGTYEKREREREERVRRLLGEKRRVGKGLDELDNGDGEEEAGSEAEGDDDWDSETEGWKEIDGEMDGYGVDW